MQRELLQEKSLNRFNGNAEKSLNVDLSAKSRLIPFSTTAGMLGLYDLYTEERNACECYRMIFTVNPVCTNVLYNAVTEPVFMEGTYSAITLIERPVNVNDDIFSEGTINKTNPIDKIQAIKDTEYSHERIGNFKYHCGYDIFNNHLLRTDEFEHVGKSSDNNMVFNTIEDYAVDYSGKTVERVIGENEGPFYISQTQGRYPSEGRTKIRLYSIDTIKSMSRAFYDNFRLVDGWYGFYNSGYINIPNCKLQGKDISLNRILNNEVSCGFIDMYPDRSLYSFIPKPNRFRRRLERNWDCTIVYPYESDAEMFKKINDDNEAYAVKVFSAKIVYDNVGNEQIQMMSLLRHTIKAGDNVRLFYKGKNSGLKRYSVPVTVISVGDENGAETNRYFKIKFFDIKTFCDIKEDEETGEKSLVLRETGEDIMFFYKKNENGCDNKYYFRKFKEIRNYQYVQLATPYTGDDLLVMSKEPATITDESPKHIKLGDDYFERYGNSLEYTQNKIAFASNIYGDRVAQVIFNDDICVSGLKDNLGRPLTKVYFMVAKTNRGHKEWYEEGNASADTVEYSHCFGEVTSGLDLPSGATDYNVRKLHNVFKDYFDDPDYKDGLNSIMIDAPTGGYSGTPMPLESGITISADTGEPYEFYGDIVEFSKVNFTETVIEKVYHRFNTAQRECLKNDKYFDINYDKLVGDIYDVEENG